jgi:SNF2 family DNA or RNA helicase
LAHRSNVQHPGCLDFCLKSIPIQPWAHQLKILRRVADKFPCSFLIADEVGLGKTIETGLILRYLIVSQKVKRVLILAPAIAVRINVRTFSNNEFLPPSTDESATRLYPLPTNQ